MQAWKRVLVAALLLGAVSLLGVHYDMVEERHWPYPDEDRLATEYEQYTGQVALLFGTVEEVHAETRTARVTVEHSTGTFSMTVREFDAAVESGGTVQVLGTLKPGHVIVAERVVVVNPAGGSTLYKYAVSLVGALLVLLVFFGHWRVNRATLSFEAR